jgi:hypothetical protein
MNKLKNIISFIIILFYSIKISAQQEVEFVHQDDSLRKGWYFGINMGAMFPDNYSANFYNGSSENINKISIILDNQYYKSIIIQQIGYNYLSYELPYKMSYQPNFTVGGYVRYQFSNRSSLILQANYARLTANDVFLLYLEIPEGYSFDANYIECQIMGQEERTYIDLGYRLDLRYRERYFPFIETGVNINNTKVLKNMIRIKNQEYSIKYSGEHPIGPYSQDYYDIYEGGIGAGGFFTLGYALNFNANISIDPSLTFYFTSTHLEGYTSMKPAFNLLVRLMFRNFNF